MDGKAFWNRIEYYASILDARCVLDAFYCVLVSMSIIVYKFTRPEKSGVGRKHQVTIYATD